MSTAVAELTLQQIKDASARLPHKEQEELLAHLDEQVTSHLLETIEHPPAMTEEEVIAELDRRMKAIKENPSLLRPWDEVKLELQRKKR
ncbi:MAG TPA: addiction module protein [Gemmatales bacterium]|nr:addiction module protein [Gemmatales bacterium]